MCIKKLINRLKKRRNIQNTSHKKMQSQSDCSAPPIAYVHTAQNREPSKDENNMVLVLWWISKKKSGYDWTTNAYPQWFQKQYGIVFNNCLHNYLNNGYLSNNDGIIKLTPAGEAILKEYDYIVYVHEHPQYCITINDYKENPNLNKVKNSDIAWGILNSRILTYSRKGMWISLAANYGNMADLLVEEKVYEKALDFIFAANYLCTSGMRDNNELTPIWVEYTRRGNKRKYLSNGMPDIFLLEINNYYVTVPFIKVQEQLKLDWQVIRDRFLMSPIIQSLESVLPFRYFEKKQSFELFKEAVAAGNKKGVFPLSSYSKKLKWNTPDEHSNRYFYASIENKINRMRGKT